MDKRNENIEKQIWQYLDGELTPQKKLEVEQRIANDPSLKETYVTAAKLHAELGQMKMESAPVTMMDAIMSSIAKEKVYVAKETSFSGLKYILGVFGGLNLLLFAYLSGSGSFTSSSSSSWTKFLGDFTLPTESFQFSIPEVPSNLLPYGLALGLMVLLFWADHFGNKLRLSKYKV